LYQLVDDPTRYRHGQASNVLDLVIVDNPEFVQNVNLCSNLGASDHVALEIILDSTIIKSEETVQKRNYFRGDYGLLRDKLRSVKWDSLKNMNVEEGYSLFLNEINNAVEMCIPIVKKSMQKKNNKWMTKDCKTCIRKKRKAWRNYIHY